MRLVSFEHGHGSAGPVCDSRTRLGALVTDPDGTVRVLDLNEACPELPADMIDFLTAGEAAMALAQETVDAVDPGSLPAADSVRLLAPVPSPGVLLGVGYNYRGHHAAGAVETTAGPAHPDVFAKVTRSVIGPGAAVEVPSASEEVDYEAELAVVIGRAGRDIPESAAMEHVAGYSIVNDVSARDWQDRSSQWVLSKSFDTFAPFGPALVTADEVQDPQDLDITLTFNGETTVRASTRDMIFTVRALVAYVSQAMTLQPGDVIATGSPQKLQQALAEPRPMRAGDLVEITIGPLGTLVTPVVDRAPSVRDPQSSPDRDPRPGAPGT